MTNLSHSHLNNLSDSAAEMKHRRALLRADLIRLRRTLAALRTRASRAHAGGRTPPDVGTLIAVALAERDEKRALLAALTPHIRRNRERYRNRLASLLKQRDGDTLAGAQPDRTTPET